jgi:hypothetical protein
MSEFEYFLGWSGDSHFEINDLGLRKLSDCHLVSEHVKSKSVRFGLSDALERRLIIGG